MPDFEERTEQATPQRRQKAKEKGQVPKSRELTSIMVSFAIFLEISMYGTKAIFNLKTVMIDIFKNLEKRDLITGLNNCFFEMSFILLPLLLAAMSVGVIVSVSQGGFVVKPIELEFNKINPLNGLSKLFSSQNFVELLKSLLKLIVGIIIFYIVVKNIVYESQILIKTDFQEIINRSLSYIYKSTKYILFTFLILSIIDYGFQYWLFEKSIRMTKEEIREEYKEQEGDPLVKSRIKSIQREIAQRRMMQDVAKSTVVITNPTHLAVALKYSKELQAPKVVAKGAEIIALKIKEIAKKNNIPIIEDKPLARALYKLDIGEYIPKELYKTVAKIIAFIFKRKQ